MEPAVTLSNVSRRYKGLVAVDGLSLDVARGEVFGLLGPNGAGKTTTINLVTGLLRSDGGVIRVLGLDPRRQARQLRRLIGLVPQDTNVYADLSAVDNLRHHAALYCGDLRAAGGRINELLKLMELWDRRKDALRTYSGGMKRRLALARAMLHDPRLVLFDEPTLGVDVQGRHVLWERIRSLSRQGTTFIVSTNDMSEADALCGRLAIIDHGRTAALDTPERLKAGLGRDVVMMQTTPAIESPEALFDGMEAANVSRLDGGWVRFEMPRAESRVHDLVYRASAGRRLESFRVARPTLDDVFLHLTGHGLRE
jgi:ABC-2 type transport system ATP-binding protein